MTPVASPWRAVTVMVPRVSMAAMGWPSKRVMVVSAGAAALVKAAQRAAASVAMRSVIFFMSCSFCLFSQI